MDEDGSSRRHTVYGNTAKEARDKAAEVRARLRANLPAKDRKITLGEFTAEWIDSSLEASDRKATTKNLYGTMARTHIIGAKIGAKPLDKLRPSHIDAWMVELKGRGLAESSIRTAYTVLRAVLDTAVRDKAIAQNQAQAVRRPKVTGKEAAYLTPDQVRSLLVAAEGSRYAPLFALLVNSGLRRGEALALHWSDIDFGAKLLRVRRTLARVDGELVVTETKTAKSRRVIPLSPTAEKVLRDMRTRQMAERLRAGPLWQPTPYARSQQSWASHAIRATRCVLSRPRRSARTCLPRSDCTRCGILLPPSCCRLACRARWSLRSSVMRASRSPVMSTATSLLTSRVRH
jgi:integrase